MTPPPNPVVCITGSSSGFGLEATIAFARRGYTVVATMRDVSRQTALVARLTPLGLLSRVLIVPLDVTDAASIRAAVDTIDQRLGRIDVLVNNAGIAVGGFLEETSEAAWRRLLETNLLGAVTVTNTVLPMMRAQQQGRIIFLSSLGGLVPTPFLGAYCAVKFALEGYAETLRLELAPFHVDVVLVEPGAFQTSIWQTPLTNERTIPDYDHVRNSFTALYQETLSKRLKNPQVVAKRLVSIAMTRHPRLRYPVGLDSWQEIYLRKLLPWRFYEQLIRKILNLEPRGSGDNK
ncbi:MAG: SDR family NAD(P)-dependent oxidoreductase [Sulfobacillus sp.]|nr:SDR family NAD(P)-dependent oxidoreductase [Sulfobacillus sp.]